MFHYINNRPEASSFTPLFRLLDDFESYASDGRRLQRLGADRRGIPQFNPRFDMRETENSFEFHGELPGMAKEDLTIEFTDPQTIVMKGKIDRSYETSSPAEEAAGGDPKSHQATVQDAGENGEKIDDNGVVVHAPKKEIGHAAPAQRARYWHAERSVGEFMRTFTFPSPVDQDAVSASLRDGILSLSIPKAKKPVARRIAVL